MVSPDPTADGAATGGAPARRVTTRVLVLLAAVAVFVYAIDQLSKFWVVANLDPGVAVPVIGELLEFRFVRNPGAAFSLASGSTWIFSLVAASVTVFIIWFARRIRSLAWGVLFGLLLGGTAGNLTDRLVRDPGFGVGHVVDFLAIWGFPAIFNLADVAIVSSMGLFILLTLRGVGLDGSRTPARRKDAGTHRAGEASDGGSSGETGEGTAPRVAPDAV